MIEPLSVKEAANLKILFLRHVNQLPAGRDRSYYITLAKHANMMSYDRAINELIELVGQATQSIADDAAALLEKLREDTRNYD